jgi:DNA-binding GntR family transcriptional regulator
MPIRSTSEFLRTAPSRSLATWTTDVLRRAILGGHFEPGERLDQDAIAGQLGVSRTPLREAIAALESEGLLTSKPHRGVFVIELTKKDIYEVFALRAVLEAEVVRRCTSSIPDSVLDKLERILEEAQKAHENGDHDAQFDADREFHKTLREYTENALLREVLEGINNRINHVRRFAQTRPGPHVDEFAREHRAILAALRQRDGEGAAELMKKHLQNSGVRVQELVEDCYPNNESKRSRPQERGV